MEVQTDAIRGTYAELVDAAEDVRNVLGAVANDELELTPVVQTWLVRQVERIELALAAAGNPAAGPEHAFGGRM
jgi:hypothetical protein